MNFDEVTARAAELDRQGFLPMPGETAEGFFERFRQSQEHLETLEGLLEKEGKALLFGEFQVAAGERIPPEIIDEAAVKTDALYSFENHRVPGFFLSKGVGALWGGCMIGDPDNGFAAMLLRSSFRNRRKWYFYERSELLAHELCHAMRQSLSDITLEEYFAYRTSGSFLRRNLGNCFIRERDAVLFILPALTLLGATIAKELFRAAYPLWPFWCLAAVYPLFLLLRNFASMRKVRKAEKALLAFGVENPAPILFRCTCAELETLGKLKSKEEFDAFREEISVAELRWAIINKRFFNQEEQLS